MTSLADPPSRGIFSLDPFGLSAAGVARLFALQPSAKRRLDHDDMISLFGSPRNNPLNVAYCSLDFDLNDVLCKRKDAFSLLESRAAKMRQIDGGVLAFPPPMLTSPLVDYIARLGLGSDSQIYLIIPAVQVLAVRNKLGGLASLEVQRFCASKNKKVLHKIPGRDMSLVTISSFDVEGESEVAETGARGTKRLFSAISN